MITGAKAIPFRFVLAGLTPAIHRHSLEAGVRDRDGRLGRWTRPAAAVGALANKRAGEAAPGSLHVSENGSRPVAQTVREHPEILNADATGTGPYDTAAARARLASVERTAATTASVACRSKHGKARERITLGLRRDNPERRACHLRRNGNAPCGRREARLRVIRITHSPTRADTRARFEPRAKSPAPDLHVTQQLRPSVPHHHLG